MPLEAVAEWRRSSRAIGFSDRRFLPFSGVRASGRARRSGLYFFWPSVRNAVQSGIRAAAGMERLREICASVKIPVLAIGGVKLENARECIAAGAAGIAAIRLFQDAADSAEFAAKLKAI